MAYLGSQLTSFDPTRSIPAPRDADRFSGNGSTTSFTLSRSVNAAVDIEVFVENVQQEPITAYDVNGTTLTFTGAPPSGTNNVYVVYRNFQSGAQVIMPDGSITYSKLANNLRQFTSDNLVPNGSTVAFTLSEPPADANTVFVTVDGVVQRAPVHYTTSGSTITFSSAPPAGSNVHVRHLGFRTSTTVTAIPVGTYIPQPNIANPTFTGSANVSIGANTSAPAFYIDQSANGNIGFGTTNMSTTNGLVSRTVKLAGTDNVEIVGENLNANRGFIMQGRQTGRAGNARYAQIQVGSDSNANGYFSVYTANTGSDVSAKLNIDGVGNFTSCVSDLGTSGSLYPAYFCRAWVKFNGTGTVAIGGSGNVSSITDNGVGDYTVNFAVAMPDANYSAVTGILHDSGTTYGDSMAISSTGALQAGYARFTTWIEGTGANYSDKSIVCASFFR